jgi:hypothetical protein
VHVIHCAYEPAAGVRHEQTGGRNVQPVRLPLPAISLICLMSHIVS